MVKRKVIKKVSARKKIARSRAVSFFIGVITVLLIGFMIFQYAQANNYKTVLGEKTKIDRQDPRTP